MPCVILQENGYTLHDNGISSDHSYCAPAQFSPDETNIHYETIGSHINAEHPGYKQKSTINVEHNYCAHDSKAKSIVNSCSTQQSSSTRYNNVDLGSHDNVDCQYQQHGKTDVLDEHNYCAYDTSTTQTRSCSCLTQYSTTGVHQDNADNQTPPMHTAEIACEDSYCANESHKQAETSSHDNSNHASASVAANQSKTNNSVTLYNLSNHHGRKSLVFINTAIYTQWHVPGDGNCFFHCLSLALHGNCLYSQHYRQMICAHIVEHWDVWGDLAVQSHNLQSNDSIQYTDTMVNRNEWATVCELKVACELLHVNIATWVKGQRLNDQNQQIVHYTQEVHTSSTHSNATLQLLLSNSHFTVLTEQQHTNDITEHQNRSKNLTNGEKRKCIQNSSAKDCYSKRIKRKQKTDTIPNHFKHNQSLSISDMETYQKCRKLGIYYEAPKPEESMPMQKLRERRNKKHILKSERKLNVNVHELPDPPPLSQNNNYNTIMDSIRAFELQQMSYTISHCSTCHERRIQMDMNAENTCKRCIQDKNEIKMFSADNNMDPKTPPPQLQNLTLIEQQLISRLAPVINIHMLKHGGIAANGHCVTFPQDVNEPSQILPLLPKDIKIIRVRRKGSNETSKDFNVRRSVVENALHWLKNNNPAYSDITISQQRLNDLPENGELNIETLDTNNDSVQPSHNDKGPAPQQVDPGIVDSCTASCVGLPPVNVNIREEVEGIVEKIVGPNHGKVTESRKYVTIPWPTNNNIPLSEFTTMYFFTMAFPCLFPYGSGDFHINRPRTCTSMAEWAEHLLWYEDGRFAQHPYFKFIVHNIIMRKRTLEQSSFVFKQQLGEEQLSIEELKEKIQNGDNSIAQKILYFGACLRGTNQYWAQRGKELRALTQYQINEGNGLPSFFCTGSCAEFHFKPLKRLLSMYTKDTSGFEVDLSNRNTLFAILQKNTHIVSHYFDLRTQSYFQNVMQSGFGVDAYWYRQEFAKSRGMVHWHGLCWRADHEPHNLLHEAIQKGLSNDETAETLSAWAKQNFAMTTTHPAGTDSEGKPRKHLWPPPEGTAPEPDEESNPLLKLLMDVSDSQESLLLDHLLLSNRINLHRCSDYCLQTKHGQRTCRMEFGSEQNPGKEIRSMPSIQRDKNGSLRLEMSRDHPMLVQHSQHHTQGWRANGDISLILSKSPPENPSVDDIIATERYITGYACKGNQPTGAMVELFNDMVNSADETVDSTAKPLITKLLMNTIKRDISSMEASYELLSLPLYRSSHTFQNIGFSGSRMLEKTGKTLTRSTPLDKYLARQKDDTSSWYQFICKRGNVPVMNGNAVRAVWPLTEEYCRSMLLMHMPNWRNIEDVKDGNRTWEQTFQEFIKTEHCPNFVKADVARAQQKESSDTDIKSQSDNEESCPDNENPEWMQLLKPQCEFSDPNHDLPYDDGGPDYQWSNTARNYPSGYGLKWLENLNENLSEQDTPEPNMSPNSLNKEQKFAFSLIMETLIKYQENPSSVEPLRLIISGTAGSGKSHLIKCLVKEITSLFGTKKSVQVLCPTGNSANLINGKTIHSFLKIPIGPAFNKEMSPPDGEKCKELQEKFEHLVALFVDERSLVGSKTLGWMEFLCQHGAKISKPWGGLPVIVFLGDDVQLPPVCDTPVYVGSSKSPAAVHGFLVWKQFQDAVELTTIVRQSNEQQQLKAVLQSLRTYSATAEHTRWLQQFQWENLTSQYGEALMLEMAEHALHVFPSRAAEDQHNHIQLRKANVKYPVAKMKAIDKGPHAKSATSDKASGLLATLYLCRGAKVMLTNNLCVDVGLFNGSMGVVTDIIYLEGRSPQESLPDVVMVSFNKYSGPAFLEDDPKVVPIVPIERVIDCFCHVCRRRQIPLRLGWGTTIHKCQGMTIGHGEVNRHIVIDPGTRAFESKNPGAMFVALSRAKSAGGPHELPDFAWNSNVLINEDRVCHRVDTPTTRARAKEMSKISQLADKTKQKYNELNNQESFEKLMTQLMNHNSVEE